MESVVAALSDASASPYLATTVDVPASTPSLLSPMSQSDESPRIREEDVEARPIERRTFLGRFGAVAGMAGLLGWTVGCSESSDSCDTDSGDPVDNDPTDGVDSDFGDPCDSD